VVSTLEQRDEQGGGRADDAGQSIAENSPPRTTGRLIRRRVNTSVAEKAAYRSLSLAIPHWEGQKQIKRPGFCFAEKLERVDPNVDYKETRFHGIGREPGQVLLDTPKATMVNAFRLRSGRHPF
jgi:hypothetical protein